MKLEGIHHITAMTADAQQNVDFYVGVLGLRLVKKSVNQDHTSVYHLFYADENADPGSDITFFEYPGLPRGRAGDGMIHRIVWRLASADALDFWAKRLADHGYESRRFDDSIVFDDPEGLTHELRVVENHGRAADSRNTRRSRPSTQSRASTRPARTPRTQTAAARCSSRRSDSQRRSRSARTARSSAASFAVTIAAASICTTFPRPEPGLQGAGTVHHIAFAAQPEEIEQWQQTVRAAGAHATQVIDRHYFRSVYFREPSGVLFEIATIGPGFTVDEPLEQLGEKLSLTRSTSICAPRSNPR